MFNVNKILITHFVKEIKKAYSESFGNLYPEYANVIAWTGHMALENIANTDSLYHDLDHTIMVTLVGQEILRGKHLSDGSVSPEDWVHFLIALMCHDIGYIKGVCHSDRRGAYATGIGDETVELSDKGTDAVLTKYHVDRSKLFVEERFGKNSFISTKYIKDLIKVENITSLIEMTRYPVPNKEEYKETGSFGGLVRAADFIGQLGDPSYFRKIPGLFYEFEETGANKNGGYKNPGEMRKGFAKFYWNEVRPYLNDALHFLEITQEGKEWITHLHSHVFESEHFFK
jgi:hypothetical protein